MQLNRWDIINHFIKKNKYHSYLEIGYYKGWSFDQVNYSCLVKEAVDPNPCKNREQELWSSKEEPIWGPVGEFDCSSEYSCIWKMTSDEYFANWPENRPFFDIIFIDGLHEANQVTKDIKNSLKYLSKRGVIILHDCNPPKYEHTTTGIDGCWTGDTYKAWIEFRALYSNVTYTIDTDWGVGVIKNEALNEMTISPGFPLTWEGFDSNRKDYLNLISVEEFLEKEK